MGSGLEPRFYCKLTQEFRINKIYAYLFQQTIIIKLKNKQQNAYYRTENTLIKVDYVQSKYDPFGSMKHCRLDSLGMLFHFQFH
uniref:Uncharacterized protein n=1 Tax=Arundo donax TaxID=35708 RepID=A0A0A9H7A0_ARUDO